MLRCEVVASSKSVLTVSGLISNSGTLSSPYKDCNHAWTTENWSEEDMLRVEDWSWHWHSDSMCGVRIGKIFSSRVENIVVLTTVGDVSSSKNIVGWKQLEMSVLSLLGRCHDTRTRKLLQTGCENTSNDDKWPEQSLEASRKPTFWKWTIIAFSVYHTF